MEIKVTVPIGKSGNWEISTFTVNEEQASRFNLRQAINGRGRFVDPGTYKKLTYLKTTVMSNTPAEIDDHYEFLSKATGNILINGLGLGVCLFGLIGKPNVEHITVIEISEDVIKLVAPTFAKYPYIQIIHADAYEWKPPKGVRYDYVWHDIWENISEENIEGMKKLHYKYGRRCNWQKSWCREECERQRRKDSVWGW